jgi:hypothetical protein
MSSNNVNTIPISAGANFCIWQQQMGDLPKYQKLWRHATGAAVRPAGNAPVNLLAQDAWNKVNEQAQGMLGLWLSLNLRIHLGATAALSWAALDNVLRLRTMCYIEPVLVFGTEQDIIVNSPCLVQDVPKGQINQSSMSFTKSATCKSGIVLVSLRTS